MIERPRYQDVLCSPASSARFLVVETGTADRMPSMNGLPMIRGARQPCGTVKDQAGCNLRGGQRYLDIVTRLTLLCISPGHGSLCYEGRQMTSERNSPVGSR